MMHFRHCINMPFHNIWHERMIEDMSNCNSGVDSFLQTVASSLPKLSKKHDLARAKQAESIEQCNATMQSHDRSKLHTDNHSHAAALISSRGGVIDRSTSIIPKTPFAPVFISSYLPCMQSHNNKTCEIPLLSQVPVSHHQR